MGALWLLCVAIISHSNQLSTAWPETNTTVIKAEKNSANSTAEETRINPALTVQNKSTSSPVNMLREKRGTLLQENELERRTSPKLRFSSWAGKRSEGIEEGKRAKFSSWGGKRFDEDYLNDVYENIKRAKFSSWGGKRDFIDDEKRAKFSSWAGKRDVDVINEEKRAKFNSWAGKRDFDNKRAKFSSWAGKRGKFNSWAGKRSDPEVDYDGEDWDEKPEEFSEDKRAKFSSWGGKRNPSYVGNSWSKVTPDNRMRYYRSGMGETGSENMMKLWQDLMSRKRARFSSWAGKRSDETIMDADSLERLLDAQEDEKRSKFSSWAGKRDDGEKRKFSSWGGKRGDSEEETEPSGGKVVKRSVLWGSGSVAYKRKPVFSSWGGKRSEESHAIQARSAPHLLLKTRPWGTLARPIRRQPEFYAWGGKRST